MNINPLGQGEMAVFKKKPGKEYRFSRKFPGTFVLFS